MQQKEGKKDKRERDERESGTVAVWERRGTVEKREREKEGSRLSRRAGWLCTHLRCFLRWGAWGAAIVSLSEGVIAVQQ